MIENLDFSTIDNIAVSSLKTNYICIENRDQYLFKCKKINPINEIEYLNYWRRIKKMIVEGIWGTESGGYRYAPGSLIFYGNLCLIQDTNENKQTYFIKPTISDLEWEIFYGLLEAEGFSGFSEDKEYTSDKLVLTYDKNKLPQSHREFQLFRPDGKLKTYITARENIRKLHSKKLGVPYYYNVAKNYSILGSRGGGKQIRLDEKVRIKDGWTTMGKLKKGDYVYGGNGKLAKVSWKSIPELKPYYKITLRDGREIEACGEHTWKVWDKNKNRNKNKEDVYSEITTEKMFEKYYYDRVCSNHKKKYNEIKKCKEYLYALPTNLSIEEEEKELPLDPYLLGLILGDGSITTHVGIETKDEFIKNYIIKECKRNKWTFHIDKHKDRKSVQVRITNKNKVKSIKQILKDLKLFSHKSDTKFIPEKYLYSSTKQRLELLQGLMDTDGFADKTHIEYYTVSKQLSQDVQNLIRSLGINCKTVIKKAHYRKNNIKIKCQDCYRTSLYTDKQIFKLKRKQDYIDNHNKSKAGKSKYTKTFITNIEPIGNRLGACISVENDDHTYITKDYIVTHNSYSISLGKLLHAIIVDGGRYYSDQTGLFYEFPTYAEEHALVDKKKPTVEVMAGSGDTDKSSEFISKIVASMNALAVEEEFGVWGEPGDDDYTPCPLFKDMSGSVAPGNKKRPWQHKYKVIQNGREIFEGSESKLYHPTYSAQKAKGKGSQAGAGGRVAYSAIEESGLTENTIEIHNSNTNVVSRNGVQFGVQIDLGTSGNIVAIVQTKKKFLNPQDYNIVEYDDEWEGMGKRGKIGFFLPAYMTLRQYKNNNGNTDFVAALKHIKHLRDEAAKSDDPSVLREERMNRPIVPSEMWITAKGYYLPYDESVNREKDLMKNKLYYSLMTPVKLSWNTKYSNGIEYKIDYEAEPFIEWPVNTNRSNLDGSVIIYDFPKDSIPNDFYFFTHDTYVSENIDQGGSLGVTHGWISPKYWDEYMPVTGPMVCTYIGKPLGGLKEHYNTQEMLIQMYGNPTGGLAFEANRGADCKNHYVNKGKAHLLMPRPINTEGMSMYAKRVQEYGIVVGNKISKINFLDKTYDWLVQPINVGGIKKLVIETIPCLFTVRQMIGYDIDGNFDAVSSLILAPKYIQELEAKLIKEKQQQAHNPLTFLSQNGGMFKNPDPNKSLQKRMEQYSEINPIFEN